MQAASTNRGDEAPRTLQVSDLDRLRRHSEVRRGQGAARPRRDPWLFYCDKEAVVTLQSSDFAGRCVLS